MKGENTDLNSGGFLKSVTQELFPSWCAPMLPDHTLKCPVHSVMAARKEGWTLGSQTPASTELNRSPNAFKHLLTPGTVELSASKPFDRTFDSFLVFMVNDVKRSGEYLANCLLQIDFLNESSLGFSSAFGI